VRAILILGLSALLGCSSTPATGGGGGSAPDAGLEDAANDTGVTDAGDAGDDAPDAAEAGPPADCSKSGAWAVAATSDVGRYAPGAAVLPDGRAFIAGGWDGTKKFVQKTSLIFDPATNTTTPSGSLAHPRNFPAVAEVPGGFLFAGGFNDASGSLVWAEIFHVDSGTFKATGKMASPRELFSATALPDGRVVVMGGLSAVGLKVQATAEIYDPAAGVFSPGGALLHPRFGQATLYVPAVKRVLVVGGKTTGPGGDVFVPEAEWFDPEAPAAMAFTAAGALGTPRDRATASFLPDGRVIVAGGSNAKDGTLSSTEIFDPATSAFAAGPAMGTRRMAHAATPLGDGHIVMTGGWSDSNMPASSTNAAEIFDPAAMAFAPLPALGEPRHDHAAVRLGACSVLVVGGLRVDNGVTTTPLGIERIDLGN
jgi:Galactose oxidase, central domain